MDAMPPLTKVEPEWGRVREDDGPRDVLCVACVLALMHPPALAQVLARGDYYDLPAHGIQALEVARRAVENGHRLILDKAFVAGLFADTMYRGDALCASHLAFVERSPLYLGP